MHLQPHRSETYQKRLDGFPVFCVPPHSRTITHWQFPMIMFGTTSPPDCGPAQTEPAGCLPLRPPSACHGAPGHCAGSW